VSRLVFFLGKGGVGKTTLSSATAYALSRQGRKVLIVSLDPAHNLGDVFGIRLRNEPMPMAERLDGIEVDVAQWVTRYLEESRREIKANYAYSMSLNLDSFLDILKYAPGTEEYAVLWAIEHVHQTYAGVYDTIIFDTPPTALAMRFLAMPSLSILWMQALAKLRGQILAKRQTLLKVNPTAAVLKGVTDKREDRVYGKLTSIQKRLHSLHGLFARDSYLTVVMNPDELSLAESLRIREELDRLGLRLRSVCLNKAAPAAAIPTELSERFKDCPIFASRVKPEGVQGREGLAQVDVSGLVRHLGEF
jgi:arsenite/tail-anchored protein-transporting ATPase